MSAGLPKIGADTPRHDDLLLPSERMFVAHFDAVNRVTARRKLIQHTGHLGSRLRWLRAERSLRAVAALLPSVGASRLHQLESESLPNPTLETLLALQLAYGCSSLDELLGHPTSVGWFELYLDG
jgi:hypothetical protein